MSLDAFSQAFGKTDFDGMIATARKQQAAIPPPPPPPKDDSLLTFGDLVDTINPLQHIPLVDVVYRHLTGDTIRPQGEILGGLLYGGPIGGAVAVATALLREATGFDAEETMYAAVTGDGDKKTSATANASASTDTARAAAPAVPVPAAVQTAALPTERTATQQPTQLHPAPKSSATQPTPATASATPPAARAQQNLANSNALQQLAADLAAGGQPSGNGAPAAGDPAAPTRAGKMPPRGVAPTNPQMPTGYYNNVGHRYGGYSRATADTPGKQDLPTRPLPPAGPGTWRNIALGEEPPPPGQPQTPAQTQAQAQPQTQAQPQARPQARPAPPPPAALPQPPGRSFIPASAAAPGQPPIPPPEMVSQLMMRNLEKYQAMARSADRPPAQTSYLN